MKRDDMILQSKKSLLQSENSYKMLPKHIEKASSEQLLKSLRRHNTSVDGSSPLYKAEKDKPFQIHLI